MKQWVSKATDERAEEATRESVPIPTMIAEMQSDMAEAVVPVNENVDEEPLFDWDMDNPYMSVGVCYPSMYDLRLSVRQHTIVNEFELDTTHSDTSRFRGHCASLGCPWIIRARTQHDGSVRVLCLCIFLLHCTICMFYVAAYLSLSVCACADPNK
jgi:hypothetical protein